MSEHRITESLTPNISRVNTKVSHKKFNFFLAMEDETFGQHVHCIEDYKGCQDIAVQESIL